MSPASGQEELEGRLRDFDFAEPVGLEELLGSVAALLRDGIVHTAHPRYFGLFNPTPTFAGVLGDTLVAGFNPQLAATAHAPAAVAIERRVLSFVGGCLGLPDAGGSFDERRRRGQPDRRPRRARAPLPRGGRGGLAAVDGLPTLYCSVEAHHSLVKAARMTGLGLEAVRAIRVTDELKLDVGALRDCSSSATAPGPSPFLVVATAGTTAAGAIDPLPELAELAPRDRRRAARGRRLGGAPAWSPRAAAAARRDRARRLHHVRRPQVALRAHGRRTVPDPPSTRSREHVPRGTGYMPTAEAADPYLTALQWSRRFIGLKVFLALAVAGREGYAAQIQHQPPSETACGAPAR